MRRYENRSTIMTSNRPLEEWGKLLGGVPTAGAILDRFLHHAQTIAMTGRSCRLKDHATIAGKEEKNKRAKSKHDAVVHSLVGPMTLMALGTLREALHPAASRAGMASDVQERFGSDVRIVHGAADGHFGNFGGDTSIHYTFTFPRFDAALTALGRLEFGQTAELPA
jgi:hypothetical protein